MSTTAASEAPDAVSSVSITRADGSVTAGWDAPSGAAKYHVTYSDDGGSSWHAPVDDHRNVTATSITFTADNAKSYVVGVRAGNEHGWSGWVNSPSSGPYTPPAPDPTPTPTPDPTATPTPAPTPPDAVSSVSLTRADGSVTASWDAPSGADKYHVTYSDDGGSSWRAPVDGHTNITATSLTFTADNAKSYIVGVRAGNEHGWSGWRNSPAAGPYTPPTPTATPTPAPTATPSPTPAPTATPAPTPAPGIIVQDASGNAIAALSVPEGGEASYQVKLTSQPAQDVEVCIALSVRDNNDSDITFKGEAADVVSIKLTFSADNWNTAQTVTLVAAVDGDGLNGARDVTHDAREYYSGHVDITATEVDDGLAATPPAAPAGFTATAGDGSVTLAWNDPADSSITGYQYQVNHNDTGTGNFSGWGAWQSIANSGAATTSHAISGLTNGREYRYHLRAVNAAGNSAAAPNAAPWYASATPQAAPVTLTVEGATPTTLILGLANHSGAWSYRAVTSGASASSNSCVGPVTGAEATVTGLDNNTEYTINAYSGASCGGDAIATEQEATLAAVPPAPSTDAYVGNLAQTAIPMYRCSVGSFSYTEHNACAQGFTTGDAAHGYTLQSITVPFGKGYGSPTALTVALHAADSGGNPSASAQATLSGSSAPNAAGLYTYACYSTDTSNNCDLERNTDYFIVMSTASHTGGRHDLYAWQVTASTDETVNPAGSGWAIGNIAKWNEKGSGWLAHPYGDIMMLRVAADEKAAPLAGAASLGVDPGNGYLDLSWGAVAGATSYDIRAKEAGASGWHDVAQKVTGTTYRYTTDKTINKVAVRGVSADSVGPWVELSRLTPPAGFMSTYIGAPPANGGNRGGGAQGASASGGASIAATPPQDPGDSTFVAPTLSNIYRDTYRLKARINLTFTGSTADGILGENFVCSDTDGWYWHPCGWVDVHDGNKVKYGTVDLGFNPQPGNNLLSDIQFVSYRRGNESPHENGDYKLIRSRKYHIAARTVGRVSTESSPWTVTTVLNPVYPHLQNFTYTRGTGSITMKWKPSYWTTGYEFDCDQFDQNQEPYAPDYTRCGALTNQDDTASQHTITISTWTEGDNQRNIIDTEKYDIRIWSTHANARDFWLAPIIYPLALTATNVTAGSATLELAGHTEAWWYKSATAGKTACESVAANTASVNVTGLTSGTEYIFTAYTDSACSTTLKQASGFTTPTAGDNIASKEFSVGSSPAGIWSDGETMWVASGSSVLAYTLATRNSDTGKNITLHAHNANPRGVWANDSTFYVLDREDDAIYAYKRSDGSRDTTKEINLHADNDNPIGIWSNGATMWVLDSDAPEKAFAYNLSTREREAANDYNTLEAAGNSASEDMWSDGETTWITDSFDGKVFAYNSLDKSRVSTRDYDLDTGNAKPRGIWSDGTTVWVSDGDDNKVYAYHAFPKNPLIASNLHNDAVTLTVSGHSGQWWYNSTTTGKTTCTDAGSTASVTVSGLTAGMEYTFTAYSDSGCSTAIGTALPFTTTSSPGGRITGKEFSVVDAPSAIWSDGTTMWVTSNGSNSVDVKAYTLTTGNSAVSKDLTLDTANDNPRGLWGNTSTFYVLDFSDDKVYAYKRSDDSRNSSKDIDLHADQEYPLGIWSDGTTMWVADAKVYAYTLSTKARDAAKDYSTLGAASNHSAHGIWSDGETTWIVDRFDGKVYAYNSLDKSRISTRDYELDPANDKPTGIWSNGTTVYVSDDVDDKVYAYAAFPKNKLIASSLTATGVTLTVSGHSGQWWYKATTGITTCTSAGSNASTSVTLAASTGYTFTAYSDNTCGTAIGTALPFTTPAS